jgi:hypothetical protein
MASGKREEHPANMSSNEDSKKSRYTE